MLNPQNFWVYLLLRYLSYIDGFLYDSVSCRNPTASVLSRQLSEVRLLLFSDVVSIFVNIYMNEWMNEWMTDWMNKWMNEWMNEFSSRYYCKMFWPEVAIRSLEFLWSGLWLVKFSDWGRVPQIMTTKLKLCILATIYCDCLLLCYH